MATAAYAPLRDQALGLQEIINMICWQAEPEDLPNLSLVNKQWREGTIKPMYSTFILRPDAAHVICLENLAFSSYNWAVSRIEILPTKLIEVEPINVAGWLMPGHPHNLQGIRDRLSRALRRLPRLARLRLFASQPVNPAAAPTGPSLNWRCLRELFYPCLAALAQHPRVMLEISLGFFDKLREIREFASTQGVLDLFYDRISRVSCMHPLTFAWLFPPDVLQEQQQSYENTLSEFLGRESQHELRYLTMGFDCVGPVHPFHHRMERNPIINMGGTFSKLKSLNLCGIVTSGIKMVRTLGTCSSTLLFFGLHDTFLSDGTWAAIFQVLQTCTRLKEIVLGGLTYLDKDRMNHHMAVQWMRQSALWNMLCSKNVEDQHTLRDLILYVSQDRTINYRRYRRPRRQQDWIQQLVSLAEYRESGGQIRWKNPRIASLEQFLDSQYPLAAPSQYHLLTN